MRSGLYKSNNFDPFFLRAIFCDKSKRYWLIFTAWFRSLSGTLLNRCLIQSLAELLKPLTLFQMLIFFSACAKLPRRLCGKRFSLMKLYLLMMLRRVLKIRRLSGRIRTCNSLCKRSKIISTIGLLYNVFSYFQSSL